MAIRAHGALSLSAAQQRVPAASVHATERGTALALPGSRDGMPIPAELQSLLSELNISPPTKEHAPVETVEALIAAVTDLDCSFSKNLLIKDKKAGQPGQSVRLWRRRSSPFTPPLGASGGSLRGVHS